VGTDMMHRGSMTDEYYTVYGSDLSVVSMIPFRQNRDPEDEEGVDSRVKNVMGSTTTQRDGQLLAKSLGLCHL